MSDFRSRLSSFQAAMGTSTQQQQAPNTSSAVVKQAKNDHPISSIEDSIQTLWRKTQIQKSVAASTSHLPTTNNNKEDDKNPLPIHVAICAVIVSTLPHEDIWRSWMLNHKSPNTTASMYIHAKTPSAIRNNSWVKSKLIPVSHDPNWNDIKVVQAMLSLIEYALQT
jgi:hypothetical protein